jgi:hypothetical protein
MQARLVPTVSTQPSPKLPAERFIRRIKAKIADGLAVRARPVNDSD